MEGYKGLTVIAVEADGALDGGGVYMDGAVRNVQALGVSAQDAVAMATATPAARMGLTDIGAIEVGKQAHLTAWNEAWQVSFSITTY